MIASTFVALLLSQAQLQDLVQDRPQGLAPAAEATAPARKGPDGEPQASTWSQWRGPARDGQFVGPTWPAGLDEGSLERMWKVEELGDSYATPIVTEDRVFTVGTWDEEEEVVRAYDRQTGEELWVTRWEGSMEVPFFAAKNGSWVRSTPACDGESLYVGGMRDVLVCIDTATGDVRWQVDFADRHGVKRPDFGLVCSPLIDGDALYIQAGVAIEKLDKHTGKTIWRSMAGQTGMDSAFSSPILADVHGELQLIVQTRAQLVGLSPEDGSVKWTHDVKAFRGMNILTPLPVGEGFFTAAYGGRAQRIDVAKTADGYETKSAWQHKAQGYMTSPVLIDGHAFLFLRSNRFASVPLDDGEGGYISAPTGDEYMSLVAQGDRILALTESGMLRMVRANPDEFDVLGEVQVVEGETWSHLAAAGDQIFIREQNGLYAFRWAQAAQ